MCEIDHTLKLCTCDDVIDTKQPHWELKRKKKDQSNSPIKMGIPIFNKPALLETELCKELNKRNCFDFDYKAEDGDMFYIKLSNRSFSLCFNNGSWSGKPPFDTVSRYIKHKGYVQ